MPEQKQKQMSVFLACDILEIKIAVIVKQRFHPLNLFNKSLTLLFVKNNRKLMNKILGKN